MPLVVKDRVKETTTTTGTGTLTLAGAVTGFQAFSVIGDGNTTYYTITDGTNFEVGVGTYTLSGTTLSRDTILESSNSGSAVNFSAGSKEVFVTYPAERAVYTDGAGTAITPATASTLGVVSGGTGAATLTANNVVLGNGTSAVQFVAPGTSGNVLTSNGSTWTSAAGGSGDVVGPASATDNAVARFDSTTGKLIQNSAVTIADTSGDITTGGVVLTANGSASNPSYSASGDTNTGIFFSAANTVDIATDGVAQAQINSAGDFAINAGFGSVGKAYLCRAWVNFNGTGTVAIRDEGNVSTITDNNTGDYTVNFTTAMPDGNYSVAGAGRSADNGLASTMRVVSICSVGTLANAMQTSSVRVSTQSSNGGVNDIQVVSVAVFR